MYVQTYLHMYVWTYVRTVDDVMAIKPNFLALIGYQYFLIYGALRARIELHYNFMAQTRTLNY